MFIDLSRAFDSITVTDLPQSYCASSDLNFRIKCLLSNRFSFQKSTNHVRVYVTYRK